LHVIDDPELSIEKLAHCLDQIRLGVIYNASYYDTFLQDGPTDPLLGGPSNVFSPFFNFTLRRP